MRLGLSVFVALLSFSGPTMAQKKDSLSGHYPFQGIVEVGGLGSNMSQTPFWLRTNQYGIVPLGGSAGTIRATLFRNYQTMPTPDSALARRSRFDWGFGVAVVGNTGPVTRLDPNLNDARQVLWPELFAKVRFGQIELFAGRRREVYGLGDTTLTSGFVAWSGNAIPFPKIQLHTPGFVPIGWLRKAVAYRFGYAHGWFTSPLTPGTRLHQKYLYVRLGKPAARFSVTGGLNHQVQWGGQADYLRNTLFSATGQLPDSFPDYVSVVLGKYPGDIENERFTDFDGTNRVGNHVGSIDVAFNLTNNRRDWLLYHQHIYEDASGLSFQNTPDGLTGLRWLNRKPVGRGRVQLIRVVVEYLHTLNQSGDTFDQRARFQGRDNYFNHGQYADGWSYKGRTIGTPFVAPRSTFTPAVNANTGGGLFPNNRLVVGYVGAEMLIGRKITLLSRLAWSRNSGSYNQPYIPVYEQLSALLTAQGRLPALPGVWLTTSVALDRGELYPNGVGGFVSLQKRW